MVITVPNFCLILLIGPSGSGKSEFAKKHFKSTEIVSSDFCRGIVGDDESDQSISEHAFDLLHYIAEKRLFLGKLTVIDATNLHQAARKELIKIAERNNCLYVAIIFNLSEKLCKERDSKRKERRVGEGVIKKHFQMLKSSIDNIYKESFKYVYILNSQEEINSIEIKREG